jgi:hypothetical protein
MQVIQPVTGRDPGNGPLVRLSGPDVGADEIGMLWAARDVFGQGVADVDADR